MTRRHNIKFPTVYPTIFLPKLTFCIQSYACSNRLKYFVFVDFLVLVVVSVVSRSQGAQRRMALVVLFRILALFLLLC